MPTTEMSTQSNRQQQPPEISVVIVNYNTADLLEQCLVSVLAEQVPMEIIVVDNASTDDSVPRVRSRFKQVHLVASEINLGFGKANNKAIKMAGGRYCLLLNPDTKVLPGAFKAMLQYMDLHPDTGLAGASILNPDHTPQPSVEHRYPGQRHTSHELEGLPGDIAWVLGACMMARTRMLEQIGGFDDDFFLYAEEIDLCLRCRKNGWKIGYIPEAAVIHWGGQSETASTPVSVWRKKTNAEIIFYKKHYTADAYERIRRANMLQARWRIFSLGITLAFARNKGSGIAKREKYRAVLDIFKNTP